MLFGCGSSVNQKAIISYKDSENLGRQNIKTIESSLVNVSQKKYDGHTIFALDLLGVDGRKDNYLSKVPYVSRSQYFLRTQNQAAGVKDNYTNSYLKNIKEQGVSRKALLDRLSLKSSAKIRDLQIFTNRIYKKIKLHQIRHINPLRQTVAKMDQYLSNARVNLKKMSLDQKLLVLRKSLAVLENLPAALPIDNFRVSSRFKMRWHPIKRKNVMHKGIDIVGRSHAPILSAGNGRVSFAGRQKGYGNVIIIEHSNNTSTLYAHLNSIFVSQGERVKVGQNIGLQGSSGSSTSQHLHYEVRLKNVHVDPEIFIAY